MKNLTSKEINLLRHNARSVVRELGLLNDAYYDIGVTLSERHLLIELISCKCPSMGDVAKRLLLDKSTISRLIAKALKKGYVQCSKDEKDKRKRYIHLTELGKDTLNRFEPIAFNQTKEALLTLTPEEIELVHKGIACYAKGLKNSRLQNNLLIEGEENFKISNDQIFQNKSLLEISKQLAILGYTIKPFSQEDESSLYEIFREVVDTGNQFPYECNSIQEFYRQFLTATSYLYICYSSSNELVGGFYIRSNYSGRSSHIANAAYMIKSSFQGQGIGTLLVNASLEIAKELGFQAMQFNLVLSQNTVAIKLYQKLGFNIIGTIPEAIGNPDGTHQDAHILHRKLNT